MADVVSHVDVPATKTNTIAIRYPLADVGEHLFILQEFPKLGLTESVGFHLYEASVLLAQYLALEYKSDVTKQKRVLELGSGSCALAGLAMTWLDYQVTFTDLPGILPTLTINVERNARYYSRHRIVPLRWGELDEAKKLGEEFDLVIGADVVYQQECVIPLLQTLACCCKREALICAEVRDESLVDEYFPAEAKKAGFAVKRVKIKSLPVPFSDPERSEHLRLFKLVRTSKS